MLEFTNQNPIPNRVTAAVFVALVSIACAGEDDSSSMSDTTAGGGGEGSSASGGGTVCQTGDALPCDCAPREVGFEDCLPDGSGFSGQCEACEPDLPATVRVEVLSVAMMPGASPTESWDPGATPPAAAWEVAALVAGVPGTGTAVKAIVDYAITGTSAPDVGGTFELLIDGQWEAITVNPQQDAQTPTWPGIIIWEHVTLDEELQLRASLYDNDIANNDEIPPFTIGPNDLSAAWVDGGAYWIEGTEILDQTRQGVLGIQVQLISE